MTEPYKLFLYKNGDSQSNFLREVRNYPMLTEAEEMKYISAWQKKSDPKSLHALVTSHLRLVVKLANGFRRYGLNQEDLISEGCVGMMQSIDRFDPDKGFRLSTYAKWWIRAAMQEYIMRSWSLVRIGTTVGQKKLFFNLRRMKHELSGTNEGQLSEDDIEFIMDQLKVAKHEVMAMDGRMSSPDSSLNDIVGDEDQTEWQDRLIDESNSPEDSVAAYQEREFQRNLVFSALDDLPEREREIFITRRMNEEKSTLSELGQLFQISPERVRQIEHSVFSKIQKIVVEEHQHIAGLA
ncbi:MAG: RNA polymerase factor sigma-32 [Rhodospirillaceae bacterium]|nr:RNA polymerase factor sigma-32 [Rhodospirillaceae bacterium]